MAVLQVDGLVKYYGEFLMFNKLSFSISENERVALIARNGAGKTTLFNIIAGNDTGSDGTIYKDPNFRFSILHQTENFSEQNTVIDEVFATDDPVVSVVKEYDVALLTGDAKRIELAVAEMDKLGAWNVESLAKQILSKLKIDNVEQTVSTLSGGQRKRLALAKVLLQKPDVLLLDEPTNHLDMDMIDWLEGYLKTSNTTIFVITHDRYFIDRLCTSILELDDGNIRTFRGNYSYYLEKKQEIEASQRATIEKAQNLYKNELQWIRRQPKARGTKAKYRIDAFEDVKRVAHTNLKKNLVQIDFKAQRVGSKILDIKGISKSFGEKSLFDNFSYTFSKGEKIALVGENGSGKSTFIKIITGNLPADAGSIDCGETINFGYYRQDGLPEYPSEKKVIDVITDISESISLDGKTTMSALKYLEYFLFPPSMHYVSVNKLSGGERKRLYLMTVLMGQPNFLVLDEPTNDLDILTLNVLENFLEGFNGCVIIVSHDRYFTDKVVNNLFVFDSSTSEIMNFPGNYTDYLEYKKQKEKAEESRSKIKADEVSSLVQSDRNQKISLTYAERLELEKIEQQLGYLNEEKDLKEKDLYAGNLAQEEILAVSNRVGEILEEIELLELRWLELEEKKEA